MQQALPQLQQAPIQEAPPSELSLLLKDLVSPETSESPCLGQVDL